MFIIFSTKRLCIRKANDDDRDIRFLFSLWTNPDVMKFVGFPDGLKVTIEQVREGILNQDESEYNQKLLIELLHSGILIGECKLGLPDENGVSETDVKLFPEYWGKGYGTEVKQGLVDYLFIHTDCTVIKATPNILNIASQKMQEKVGGQRIGQEMFCFPEYMKEYTSNVHSYIYHLTRKDWLKQRDHSGRATRPSDV